MLRQAFAAVAVAVFSIATSLPARPTLDAVRPSITCNGTFQRDPTPNPLASDQLNAVTAVAATDLWATGTASNPGSRTVPLTEHWDGKHWRAVPAPAVGADRNELDGVAASATNDVWAVGSESGATTAGALIEHWNGSAWRAAAVPASALFLSGVVAITRTDAWAVGSNLAHTIVMHWDGNTWSLVASPDGVNQNNFLSAVAALGPADIWAVGNSAPAGSDGVPLVERWNGASWSASGGASISGQGYLSSVAALASNDVWAVGSRIGPRRSSTTLIENWNGTKWRVVPSPNGTSAFNALTAVAPIAADDVWAFGNDNSGPLAMHWDGSAWSLVTTVAGTDVWLGATSDSSTHRLWTVGYRSAAQGASHTVAEHLCPA